MSSPLDVQATLDGGTHRYTVPEQRNVPAKMKAIQIAEPEAVPIGPAGLDMRIADTDLKAIRRSDMLGTGLHRPLSLCWRRTVCPIPWTRCIIRGAHCFSTSPLRIVCTVTRIRFSRFRTSGKGCSSRTSRPILRALLSVKRLFPRSIYYDDLEVTPRIWKVSQRLRSVVTVMQTTASIWHTLQFTLRRSTWLPSLSILILANWVSIAGSSSIAGTLY